MKKIFTLILATTSLCSAALAQTAVKPSTVQKETKLRGTDIFVTLGGSQGGMINMEAIKKSDKIDVGFRGESYPCTITAYKITIIHKAGDRYEFQAKSNLLTDEMKQSLSALKSGDMIMVHDIHCKLALGEPQELQASKYLVE